MRTAILAVAVAATVLTSGCGRRDRVPVTEATQTYDVQAQAAPAGAGMQPPAALTADQAAVARERPPAGKGDWGQTPPAPEPSAPAAEPAPAQADNPLPVAPPAQVVPADAPAQAASAGPVQTTGAPKIVSASLMQVNDQFLTIDDVLRRCAVELAELPQPISEPTFRQQARKIIEEQARQQTRRMLVYPEADARIGEQIKQWVDNEMAQVQRDLVARADGSKRQLETRLRSQHTSLEEVLGNHRQQLIVQEFLRWKFLPGVSVTRSAMLEYYRAHAEEFSTPAKAQMQIIAVPYAALLEGLGGQPSPEELQAAKTQARSQIEQAQQALKAGQDFADVARRFSKDPKAGQGGIWPMMPAGSFKAQAVEQAAFAMEEGQVSDVIQTPDAAYIVRAYKVQPGRQTSFELAQAKIERIVREQQLMQRYEEYYRQLLSKATVIQSGDFVGAAVDKAVELYYRPKAAQS
jgi:parvulin-like peptidyl-prolyl isomerase